MVAISLGNLPRETLAPLVNVVASSYVQGCQSEWTVQTEQAYSAAQEAIREAQRLAQEADSRLELLRQRQGQRLQLAFAKPQQPTAVENPQCAEAAHRLAELDQRRRALLERTPLHPAVRELDLRIQELQRKMATIPQQIFQQPSASPPSESPAQPWPPAGPSEGEVEAAQQAATRLHGQLEQAEATAHAALAVRGENLHVNLDPAAEPPATPSAVAQVNPSLWAHSLLLAATSVIGLGMISFGASLERPLSSISELQAVLPVPIVGVVPAAHPSRRSASSLPRLWAGRVLAITAGLALLSAAAWLVVQG